LAPNSIGAASKFIDEDMDDGVSLRGGEQDFVA